MARIKTSEDWHSCDVIESYNPLVFFVELLSVQTILNSFVDDIVFCGRHDWMQIAVEDDKGPVEGHLLLGLHFPCLPPAFGSKNWRDPPSQPLGCLSLPNYIFGVLHGQGFSWDILRHMEKRKKKKNRNYHKLKVSPLMCFSWCTVEWPFWLNW